MVKMNEEISVTFDMINSFINENKDFSLSETITINKKLSEYIKIAKAFIDTAPMIASFRITYIENMAFYAAFSSSKNARGDLDTMIKSMNTAFDNLKSAIHNVLEGNDVSAFYKKYTLAKSDFNKYTADVKTVLKFVNQLATDRENTEPFDYTKLKNSNTSPILSKIESNSISELSAKLNGFSRLAYLLTNENGFNPQDITSKELVSYYKTAKALTSKTVFETLLDDNGNVILDSDGVEVLRVA